jgi:hypothetical protein
MPARKRKAERELSNNRSAVRTRERYNNMGYDQRRVDLERSRFDSKYSREIKKLEGTGEYQDTPPYLKKYLEQDVKERVEREL